MSEQQSTLSIGEIKDVALKELQEGARPMSSVKLACYHEHRVRVADAKVWDALGQLRAENKVERLDDPEEWYRLSDWEERPLRVMGVSHHVTKIEGVSQLEEVWLNESIRAARYEHGIESRALQPMPPDDERNGYLISTRDLDVLDRLRETLRRLARETEDSAPEKAAVYGRLAEATDLGDQFDTRDEVVELRAGE